MTIMYCPKCEMNVFTVREELDIGLIIILCIFTAGIGVIIYLAIYYDKDSNRCIHCKSICQPIKVEQTTQNSIRLLTNNSNVNLKDFPIEKTNVNRANVKYCFNCGIELDERQELNFCSYCGAKIK